MVKHIHRQSLKSRPEMSIPTSCFPSNSTDKYTKKVFAPQLHTLGLVAFPILRGQVVSIGLSKNLHLVRAHEYMYIYIYILHFALEITFDITSHYTLHHIT